MKTHGDPQSRSRFTTSLPQVLVAIFLLVISAGADRNVFAQASWHDITLSRGLIIRSAPGFPDAVAMKNPIEAAIVESRWTSPHAGETVVYNDSVDGTWTSVTADSAGWFDHPLLNGAYLYFEVEWTRDETVLLEPMANAMAYVNGEPRTGNAYGYKDVWDAWEPRFDFTIIPIAMHKGTNWFLFQCTRGNFKARLRPALSQHFMNVKDCTLPDLIDGQPYEGSAAVVVVNASPAPMKGWTIGAAIGDDREIVSRVPIIQPMSLRKIPFALSSRPRRAGPDARIHLRLFRDSVVHDTVSMPIRVVGAHACRKETFVSDIDSSVQYFAVNPASNDSGQKALVLSLHGAGVEAINQASSYAPKSWATIICPTNRRPYGFNWEDWGRTDAMEAYRRAVREFAPDPARRYLTGHSMGGHGVYHIGSLFPDQFGAIAPSAGWVSFWTYRVREKIEHPSMFREMIMRPTLVSDTYTMARNFSSLGVYILHGSEDDNVLPEQSRMMAKHLAGFHHDFVYHEEQGVGHWWDRSDDAGADCVDWAPMFDFFARHARPESSRLREVHFATPNLAITATYYWSTIEAQIHASTLSTIDMLIEPGVRRFVGTTTNVRRLALRVRDVLTHGPFAVIVDSQTIAGIAWPSTGELHLARDKGVWRVAEPPSPMLKGPQRNGPFREVFGRNAVLVFGTHGTPEENRWAFEKARFDAERFWYQGNGSLEVLADSEFSVRDIPRRNVILYGNGTTNSVWPLLLSSSPIVVTRGSIRFASHEFTGDSLSCLFLRPIEGTANGLVGAVSGTGLAGMKGTTMMPYLLPGIGFPDVLVTTTEVLMSGERGAVVAGFFGDDWTVPGGEFVYQEPGQ